MYPSIPTQPSTLPRFKAPQTHPSPTAAIAGGDVVAVELLPLHRWRNEFGCVWSLPKAPKDRRLGQRLVRVKTLGYGLGIGLVGGGETFSPKF